MPLGPGKASQALVGRPKANSSLDRSTVVSFPRDGGSRYPMVPPSQPDQGGCQILRRTRLVETARRGKYVLCSLTSEAEVVGLIEAPGRNLPASCWNCPRTARRGSR